LRSNLSGYEEDMTIEARPIHIGIGGWDYDPWRGTFYPAGLAKTKQLQFASRAVTAIEINATYYKLQRPELFERWAADVPDGFVFAVKASRFCTNRKLLGDGGESIERFCGQGFTRLGDKLGPILWQFMESKRFDPEDIAAFFALLPKEQDGVPLRHAVEARHESFRDPRFVDLARNAGVAICYDDSAGYPAIADATADFAYARLMRSREEEPDGYSPAELDHWANVARQWAYGEPDGLSLAADPVAPVPREVFMFVISGDKVRAPAAAQALMARTHKERPR
jgi:uncharacterized protein YecE (DUF72 family)